MILGILTGILLELVASVIVTGWVGLLFKAFKIALVLTWILQLYDLYTSWELTQDPKYLQEIGVQLAAGITVYGIFKGGLHDKVQEFIKWAENINIGGGNSGTPGTGQGEGGTQGTGQGEGGTPGAGRGEGGTPGAGQGEGGNPGAGQGEGGLTSQQPKPGREILPKIRKIIYGETKLSEYAKNFRIQNNYRSAGRNVCAVEYLENGVKQIEAFISDSKGNHSEELMLEFLKGKGISGEDVLAIFTEREPCVTTDSNNHNCTQLLLDYCSDAEVTYATEWLTDNGSKSAARDFLRGLISAFFGEE